jgi:hypothetical protein
MGDITQVKYLMPIVPDAHQELLIKIVYKYTDDKKIKTTITISRSDMIFTKARIIFTP